MTQPHPTHVLRPTDPTCTLCNEVSAWASEHKALLRSWDDLPLVNVHRERGMLPTFARKFPTKGVRG